jgi:hypothetical protein
MPAEYRIDREKRIVFSRAWGETVPDDFRAHGQRLVADPDFSPDHRQLWDLSEITISNTDFEALSRLSQTTVFAPTARRAFLAPLDVSYGIGRMFQMLRESKGETGIRVFRDRAEAMRWLETGEDPPPPPRVGSSNPLKNPPPRG